MRQAGNDEASKMTDPAVLEPPDNTLLRHQEFVTGMEGLEGIIQKIEHNISKKKSRLC